MSVPHSLSSCYHKDPTAFLIYLSPVNYSYHFHFKHGLLPLFVSPDRVSNKNMTALFTQPRTGCVCWVVGGGGVSRVTIIIGCFQTYAGSHSSKDNITECL